MVDCLAIWPIIIAVMPLLQLWRFMDLERLARLIKSRNYRILFFVKRCAIVARIEGEKTTGINHFQNHTYTREYIEINKNLIFNIIFVAICRNVM